MNKRRKSIYEQENKQSRILKNIEETKSSLANLNASRDRLLDLTEKSLTELQAKLKEKQISPVDLLHAYQLKALQLYNAGNSGICEFILEADEQAKVLSVDANEKSELYGIPISVKEICSVKGYDSTFGLRKLCQKPAIEDSVVVKVLREAGAIPFVLTATSQAALTVSGINPIFGDMRNPHSPIHEPGGSSNGEAVLLAQNGSPIGIGTDLAGSIRIPSAFCGLAGLKPTSCRLSSLGNRNLFPDTVVMLKVAVGPMGKKVDDLAKAMRTLLQPSMFRLDPTIPPLPFNEDLYRGVGHPKLTIGYYDTLDDANIVQTVPSIRRAVENAVNILKQEGHNLVKFAPPEPHNALKLCLGALATDGGQALAEVLTDEPLNEHTKGLKLLAGVPAMLRILIDTTLRRSVGNQAATAQMVKKLSTSSQVIDLMNQIRSYQTQFLKAWADAGNLDALICPVWAHPAPEINTSSYHMTAPVIYSFMYNLIDYPAGAVPMGKVIDQDVEKSSKLAEECKRTGDIFHEKLFNSQAQSKGLPLSVQVVCKPYREEIVLRVMKELESGNHD